MFAADKYFSVLHQAQTAFKKNSVRALVVCLIVAMSVVVVYRSDVVYGRIMEASVYYSTTDLKAMDAGVWLKENYPENTTGGMH